MTVQTTPAAVKEREKVDGVEFEKSAHTMFGSLDHREKNGKAK